MGFAIYYRSTRPVNPEAADAIRDEAARLGEGRTWLSCEPVHFRRQEDGHLFGGSKPNFEPHADDVASAAREGLPDGTPRDLLDILCTLSRDHSIDWEISHDYSNGPVGYVRAGVCDDAVLGQLEAFGDLGDLLRDLTENDDTDDDGPPILAFEPKRK